MSQTTLTERVVRRERVIIALAIGVLACLAWLYVLWGAGTGMSAPAMTTWQFPPPRPATTAMGDWSPGYWLTMLVMWWVMMIAMMIPSAAPAILLHARVVRHGQARGQIEDPLVPSAAFATGYLAIWLGFSVLAVALQFALERFGLLHGMMMWSTSRAAYRRAADRGGALPAHAAQDDLSRHCRSPSEFLTRNWHPGRAGAFRMGLVHGAHCLGCCWALMLLLFAAGIMNLVWIAGLAILVLLEKLAPFGARLSRLTAALLIGVGLYVAIA